MGNHVTRAQRSGPSLKSLVRRAEANTQQTVNDREAYFGHAQTLHSGPGDTPPLDGAFKPPVVKNRETVLPITTNSSESQQPKLMPNLRQRFSVKRRIGSGSMGFVELAVDEDIQRHVAIKKLKQSKNTAAIARLAEEIRINGQLEHPNIAPIHDVGLSADGEYFFVMRFVDGLNLRQVIEGLKRGDKALHARFSFQERVRIFRDVLSAIAFAHERGILHQDLKPENIMVGGQGEVFVMDWGLAMHATQGELEQLRLDCLNRMPVSKTDTAIRHKLNQDSRRLNIVGTPAYMAPEQTRGDFNMRSEVYALAVIFHELMGLEHYLDGRYAIRETIQGVRNISVPPVFQQKSPYQGRVPIEWSHYIQKGVHKNINDRYPSVRAMYLALNAVDDGHFAIECPTSLMKRALTKAIQLVDNYPRLSFSLLLGGTCSAIFASVSSLLA